MILTKKLVFKPDKEQLIVLNSLSHSSAKLWNIANYEKRNYKSLEFKPLANSKYQINIAYKIGDLPLVEDNGHYLSIDIGLKNLFTCYDNTGISFIVNK